MIISQNLKRDKMELIFISNGYFVRASDPTDTIKYKFTCSAEIPAQLVMTSAIKSMESAGNFAESSMNYLLYGNLGLQLFMSVSMQLLWGMVNTL